MVDHSKVRKPIKCAVCRDDIRGIRVTYVDSKFDASYCGIRCARIKFFTDMDLIVLDLWELHKQEHLTEHIYREE